MSVEPRRTTAAGGLLASIVCAALTLASVAPAAPAMADDATDPAGTLVGDFSLGDGLEAMIDERDGALSFTLPAGGLELGWSSRAAGDDDGLGGGWGFDLGRVDIDGGVRVRTASGRVYELDRTHESGLAGYGAHDLVFEAVDGRLPPREGTDEPVAYRFALHELGGHSTYFGERGDPVAEVDATTGRRTDWSWSPAGRLIRVVSADGVRTELDWQPGMLAIRPAADLASAPAPTVVRWSTSGVRSITDPTGGHVDLDYADGLVTRIAGVAGAVTEVRWQRFDDAAPRVDRLRTTDASGIELSARTWARSGTELPTGWPARDPGGALPDPLASFATVLSDGRSLVRSSYGALGTLRERRLLASTGSGERELQAQSFGYPGDAQSSLDPTALPPAWAKPSSATLRSTADGGAVREVTESFEFDEFGRPVLQRAADGATVETEYDTEPRPRAGGARPLPPIGLPILERTATPDGLVTETRHTLDETRTAIIATTTSANAAGGAVATTARTEFTVDTDGFVTELRAYPGGDGDAKPIVTTRARATDQVAATRTITETAAAGTPAAATTARTVSLVHGGPIAETSASGATTTTGYDALGRAVKQTDHAGNATRIRHETVQQHGRNATVVVRPDHVETVEIRDELGRVIRSTDNLRGGRATAGHTRVQQTIAYPDAATTVVTDAWGATTTTTRDVFGRVVRTVAPNGLVELTEYDDVADRVTTALTPTGRLADAELVHIRQRDASARTATVSGTRADGLEAPVVTERFDGLGRLVSASEPRLETRVELDPGGAPERTTFTASGGSDAATVADREFDGFDASVQKILSDARGTHVGTRRVLDALGRPVAELDRAGRETTSTFTPDGLLETRHEPSGQTIRFTYDAVTRETTSSTATSPVGADVTTATTIDAVTGRVTSRYDPADRAGTEIRYEYDDFGNSLTISYPGGRLIRHAYDEHGRKAQTTDASGRVTTYAHDAAGLLTEAVQRDASGGELARVRYTYDAFGRVVELERGNGVVTEYTFTSASEIASEITSRDGERQSAREYTYDADGLLVRRVDRVGPGDAETTATGYRYDALGRLTGSTVHRGADGSAPVERATEYELGVGGDVERETVTDRPGRADERVSTREFSYSALGELLAITTDGIRRDQRYDAAGNLAVDADGTRYTYDAANRPVSTTTGASTTTIAYWPDGTRRSRSTVDAETGAERLVEYFWDDGELLSEVHTGTRAGEAGDEANGDAGYLIGLSRHARVTSTEPSATAGATSYYTADRHGSITELTDQRGAVVERYAYADYGAATISSGRDAPRSAQPIHRNPFGFAGELTDPDGWQSLGPRRYHPATMRFGSADTADVVSPYAYAGLNPVTKADPSGHMPEWDTVINGVLAGVGAIVLGFTATTLAAAVPMLGAPATLWTAYGFGWAAALGDLFTTTVAVVQVASDLSPRGHRLISESDSEILTWTSLGVGLATFAAGLVSSAFLRETARDAEEMLLELDAQNGTRHFNLNYRKGTFDEKWAAGRTVYVELKWVDPPVGYRAPKRRSMVPSNPAQAGSEQKRQTLSRDSCATKCDTIIDGISHAGAKSAASNAVTRFMNLTAQPKVPRAASESVFTNLIEYVKGIHGLPQSDLTALDELRTTALTLE